MYDLRVSLIDIRYAKEEKHSVKTLKRKEAHACKNLLSNKHRIRRRNKYELYRDDGKRSIFTVS